MYSALYKRSPVAVQETLLSLRGQARAWMRENAAFRNVLHETEARQHWSRPQLLAWQQARLTAVLAHAGAAVPFYRQALAATGGATVDQYLALLPVLTKAAIVAAPHEFMAEGRRFALKFSGSTSGTTGSPLTLVQDIHAIRRENAFIWRQLHWAGYRRGERRVWLRGDMVVPAGQRHGPYWRRNWLENMLMMSSYHLSEASASGYLNALRRFAPVLIQAYPSSIGYLANWLHHRGANAGIPSLRGIVTSSETLTPQQRERIEVTFGVPVFDWYGSFERVAAIGTCPLGHYHLMEDYGYTEFLPRADGLHELVSTGFNNELMPLLRYASGDLVELSDDDAPCACGLPFRHVKRIHGRQDDIIKTPDGRVIGRLDHIYKGVTGIVEAQIVQERLDTIEVRVVPSGDERDWPRVERLLLDNLRERVGADMQLQVRFVTALERTKNGKLRAVVCKI